MPTVPSSRARRAATRNSRARRTRPHTESSLSPSPSPSSSSQASQDNDSDPREVSGLGSGASLISPRGTKRPRAASSSSSPRPRPRPPAPLPASPPRPVSESFWPNIRRFIGNNGTEGDQAPLRGDCPICHDELPIRGLNPSEEVLKNNPGVVISCGHIFCKPCLEQAFKTQREQVQPRTCPVCRKKMECKHCGLQARMITIPKVPNEPNDYTVLPKTVPEGGAQPEKCARCFAREFWTMAVEQGRRGIENNRVEAGFARLVYDMLDDMEGRQIPSGIVELEQRMVHMLQFKYWQLRGKREQYIQDFLMSRLRESPNAWQ